MPSICLPMDELCAKYKAPRYRSMEELLADKEKLMLDGVLCGASHRAHGVVGSAALDAGLHLLMEKPMAVDLDEARMLLSRAEAHPELAFLINNTANFQPGTLAAHQIVSHGRIGQVRHVNTVLASPLTWLFEGAEHTPEP